MRKQHELTDQRFGRLLVLQLDGKDKRNNRTYLCFCNPKWGGCGKFKPVAATQLTTGLVESCGCLLQEKRNANLKKAQVGQVTHGMSGTLTHNSWNAMMQRCYNYKCQSFPEYGGAGIVVCQFLRKSPANLKALIGERPKEGDYSLDRWPIQEGNYACGQCVECKERQWALNVQWSTKTEQAEHRGNAVMVEIDGIIKPRTQAAKELGMTTQQAIYHLKDKEVKTMKRVEFEAPPGTVPEGTKSGEEFDLVCTFRVSKSGQVCLIQMGDEKMPGYAEKGRDKGKPSYSDEHTAMMGNGGGETQTGYTTNA